MTNGERITSERIAGFFPRQIVSISAAVYSAFIMQPPLAEVLAGKSEAKKEKKKESFRLRSFFLIRAVATALIRG